MCPLYTRYPIVARALGLAAAQPLGRVRARAKVSCIQMCPVMMHIPFPVRYLVHCAIVEVVCEYFESLRVVIAKYKISMCVSVRVPSFMS